MSTLYEARAGTALDCGKVAKLRESLGALESTSKCEFMQLLSNGEGHRWMKTKFGEVPFGSCLSYQQLEEGAQLQSLPVAAVGGGLGSGDGEDMVNSTCNQQPPTQQPCFPADLRPRSTSPTVTQIQLLASPPDGVVDQCMNAGPFLQLPLFSNRPPASVQATSPSFQPKAVAVERLTHNQSSCSSWYKHRQNHITATKLGKR